MKIDIFTLLGCLLAIVIGATQWLPAACGLVGAGGFMVLVLSTATFALRIAKKKNLTAAGCFCVGLLLLIVATPTTRIVRDLFRPGRYTSFPEIPAEMVFGLLAVGCIARAWYLWTSDENLPNQPPLRMPASGTPAAEAPVPPQSGAGDS
jgi:hypothetical protein